MESALTISPPRPRASSIARSDLPVAVGPRTAKTRSATGRPARDDVLHAERNILVAHLGIHRRTRQQRACGGPGRSARTEQLRSKLQIERRERRAVTGGQRSEDGSIEAFGPLVPIARGSTRPPSSAVAHHDEPQPLTGGAVERASSRTPEEVRADRDRDSAGAHAKGPVDEPGAYGEGHRHPVGPVPPRLWVDRHPHPEAGEAAPGRGWIGPRLRT